VQMLSVVDYYIQVVGQVLKSQVLWEKPQASLCPQKMAQHASRRIEPLMGLGNSGK